ncbi:hypothetical protein [Nocardioides flavescens]|uniref:Outer membrane channel protein CpnT-like N-terminal domain-containing protein n=1 Tax=Nocardioides flavescens TaxID=2691959 RepID=A0A6L7F3Z7_9ACTN|nr:hypothetical protein [Nocardioides flavescens]MXG91921.1 hypothetical protein [Nocardioides flavescens]
MRIAVDAPSLGSTAVVFERANQSAATFHRGLARRLARGDGMAGDSSIAADFAEAYDDAAQLALDAVADLVDAFATCARLTRVTAGNHARAEARSVLSGRTVYEGHTPLQGFVSVLPTTVPSALGGDWTALPGWVGWVLDQVEGFVWPDADVDRLRDVAAGWRAASAQCVGLVSSCESAADSLSLTLSPEIPVALDVTGRLARRCQLLSDQCASIARSCEGYADQVEAARAEILDLVHDLLRDAVIIQGIGLVLGAVTGGMTAAGAAALNATKIAAATPRILRIVSTLRSLATVCAAPVRAAATALRDVRRDLAVFRRARLTLASTYDAERVARVARLQTIVRHPRLTDPAAFRGLSREQVREIVPNWPVSPARRGEGVVYRDPANRDRVIRVMDGYSPEERADPLTHGPYVVISQFGDVVKLPLEGNPVL